MYTLLNRELGEIIETSDLDTITSIAPTLISQSPDWMIIVGDAPEISLEIWLASSA